MESSFTPTQIGPYEILSIVGRGSLGTVYKATDTRVGRTVAIKALTVPADDPDLLLLKFYRETKNTLKLEHENIAAVYELGYGNGAPYLVMEYLEGESLESVAARRALTVSDKLNIVLQVCAGLGYAHAQEVVHRDIRPSHIVIAGDGRAKIIDFGMSRLRRNPSTQNGKFLNQLRYLAPEQVNGSVDLDGRADVYSIGVVLFQLLAGVLPSEGETPAGLVNKVTPVPPPLGKYMKDCPNELEAIAQKALATNREERYASAGDLAVDLARVQQQFEKQMIAEYLEQAKEFLAGQDFANAKEQASEVLRRFPQNAEADELRRQIEEAEEKYRRAEQVRQLRTNAEDAFRRNQYAEALHFVEQALQIDSGSAELLRLRDSVLVAQEKLANFRDAFHRAESALQSGDLQRASESINRALAILPEDSQGRRLASQIRSRIQQQLREQEIQERKRKLAADIQVVERAIADSRALLSNGQTAEALQVLERVQTEISQLPPQWAEEASSLKQEIQEKQRESMKMPAPAQFPAAPAREEMSKPPDSKDQFAGWTDTSSLQAPSPKPAPKPETEVPVRPYPRSWLDEAIESEPERPVITTPVKNRSGARSVIWVVIAIAAVLMVTLLVIFSPKRVTPSPPTAEKPAVSARLGFAEINASPWATIKDITPLRGDAQSAIGERTPLRINVPPGTYTITFEGPNHERKQAVVSVPTEGGATCCPVSFRKAGPQ